MSDNVNNETWGAQMVRKMHEDSTIILKDYDGHLRMCEDADIKAMTEEYLCFQNKWLGQLEKAWRAKYKDNGTLENSLDTCPDCGMAECQCAAMSVNDGTDAVVEEIPTSVLHDVGNEEVLESEEKGYTSSILGGAARGAGRGALYGGAVGLGGGALLAGAANVQDRNIPTRRDMGQIAQGLGVLGAGGAAVGAAGGGIRGAIQGYRDERDRRAAEKDFPDDENEAKEGDDEPRQEEEQHDEGSEETNDGEIGEGGGGQEEAPPQEGDGEGGPDADSVSDREEEEPTAEDAIEGMEKGDEMMGVEHTTEYGAESEQREETEQQEERDESEGGQDDSHQESDDESVHDESEGTPREQEDEIKEDEKGFDPGYYRSKPVPRKIAQYGEDSHQRAYRATLNDMRPKVGSDKLREAFQPKKKAIKDCTSFLDELSEEGSNFGDEQKYLAYHHYKNLEGLLPVLGIGGEGAKGFGAVAGHLALEAAKPFVASIGEGVGNAVGRGLGMHVSNAFKKPQRRRKDGEDMPQEEDKEDDLEQQEQSGEEQLPEETDEKGKIGGAIGGVIGGAAGGTMGVGLGGPAGLVTGGIGAGLGATAGSSAGSYIEDKIRGKGLIATLFDAGLFLKKLSSSWDFGTPHRIVAKHLSQRLKDMVEEDKPGQEEDNQDDGGSDYTQEHTEGADPGEEEHSQQDGGEDHDSPADDRPGDEEHVGERGEKGKIANTTRRVVGKLAQGHRGAARAAGSTVRKLGQGVVAASRGMARHTGNVSRSFISGLRGKSFVVQGQTPDGNWAQIKAFGDLGEAKSFKDTLRRKNHPEVLRLVLVKDMTDAADSVAGHAVAGLVAALGIAGTIGLSYVGGKLILHGLNAAGAAAESLKEKLRSMFGNSRVEEVNNDVVEVEVKNLPDHHVKFLDRFAQKSLGAVGQKGGSTRAGTAIGGLAGAAVGGAAGYALGGPAGGAVGVGVGGAAGGLIGSNFSSGDKKKKGKGIKSDDEVDISSYEEKPDRAGPSFSGAYDTTSPAGLPIYHRGVSQTDLPRNGKAMLEYRKKDLKAALMGVLSVLGVSVGDQGVGIKINTDPKGTGGFRAEFQVPWGKIGEVVGALVSKFGSRNVERVGNTVVVTEEPTGVTFAPDPSMKVNRPGLSDTGEKPGGRAYANNRAAREAREDAEREEGVRKGPGEVKNISVKSLMDDAKAQDELLAQQRKDLEALSATLSKLVNGSH